VAYGSKLNNDEWYAKCVRRFLQTFWLISPPQFRLMMK
jgi:hypothetical protein